jgi:hypothetical protein
MWNKVMKRFVPISCPLRQKQNSKFLDGNVNCDYLFEPFADNYVPWNKSDEHHDLIGNSDLHCSIPVRDCRRAGGKIDSRYLVGSRPSRIQISGTLDRFWA